MERESLTFIELHSTNKGLQYSLSVKASSNVTMATSLMLSLDLYLDVWANGIVAIDKKPVLQIKGIPFPSLPLFFSFPSPLLFSSHLPLSILLLLLFRCTRRRWWK